THQSWSLAPKKWVPVFWSSPAQHPLVWIYRGQAETPTRVGAVSQNCNVAPDAQAIFLRRRHQPRRPPQAKIRLKRSGPSELRERLPASHGNPHADDFDPAPADDHGFDGSRRQPSVDQLDQQLGLESVGHHDRLSAAVDGCLKQFERSTALLLRRRHRCVAYSSLSSPTTPTVISEPARSSGGGPGLDTTRLCWTAKRKNAFHFGFRRSFSPPVRISNPTPLLCSDQNDGAPSTGQDLPYAPRAGRRE